MSLFRVVGQILHTSDFLIYSESLQIVSEVFSRNDSETIQVYGLSLLSRSKGYVGGIQREVEVWSAQSGYVIKVSGCSDFYIARGGEAIVRVEDIKQNRHQPLSELSKLDREILLGLALVLALAMRSTWSLHASAAMLKSINRFHR